MVIWAIDLKRGMEFQPWAPCIDRLATTPDQAAALLADAVTILYARAQYLTDHKERQPINVEIRDGLTFLWRHKLLRTMALLIAVMAGCWSACLAIIPAYAVGGPLYLNERQYGFLLTCLGARGVLGTASSSVR